MTRALYVQLSYNLTEAKPADFSNGERVYMNGQQVSFRWGSVFDPSETAEPWYPGWEFSPNNGYDFYERSVVGATFIRPNSAELSKSIDIDPDNPIDNLYIWTSIVVPDDFIIFYDQVVPVTSDPPSGFTFSGGTALAKWDILYGTSAASAALNLRSAFQYVATEAANASSLASLVAPALNAMTVYDTLQDFMQKTLPILENGVRNFKTMNLAEYDRKVDALLRDSYADFTAALEELLGTGSQASSLLRSINLAIPIVNGDPNVKISAGYEVDISVGNGILVIGGETRAVSGSDLRDFIINLDDGLATGGERDQINLGGGNDFYIGGNGSESVQGGYGKDQISGGGAADYIFGDIGDSGSLGGADWLRGDAGADRLWGNAGNDTLYGGAGADSQFGGSGVDTLYGGTGNDTLYGSDSNDRLLSSSGNDLLYGGTGNDGFDGGTGNDRLYGGTGADRLSGGAGLDRLYGGADSSKDIFIFKSVLSSGVGSSKRDVISNFASGGDDISLSDIDANTALAGNQTFSFSGTTAKGYGVWYVDIGTDLVIRGDVNGNKTADFEIQVAGINIVAAGDFIL